MVKSVKVGDGDGYQYREYTQFGRVISRGSFLGEAYWRWGHPPISGFLKAGVPACL
jgi:hypothetical protein